jgi:Rps23 Pro-64 3,4-dihydroxylase Tpa1-like proline 4-hydroxylase
MSIITSPLLLQQGWLKFSIELPKAIEQNVKEQDYDQLDAEVAKLLDGNGLLGQKLSELLNIEKTEFILTLRQPPDDEDGIWHDDGSRELAFSLGLNLEVQQIIGGELELRQKKGDLSYQFSPLAWGEVLVFLTGIHGWEHRVLRVLQNRRLHAAGWIN